MPGHIAVWAATDKDKWKEYVDHHHEERSHQGIGNRLVSGAEPQKFGRVSARRRLGGMLSYYHRGTA